MCIKHWNLQCFLSMSLNVFNTALGKWYIPSLSGGPWGGGVCGCGFISKGCAHILPVPTWFAWHPRYRRKETWDAWWRLVAKCSTIPSRSLDYGKSFNMTLIYKLRIIACGSLCIFWNLARYLLKIWTYKHEVPKIIPQNEVHWKKCS